MSKNKIKIASSLFLTLIGLSPFCRVLAQFTPQQPTPAVPMIQNYFPTWIFLLFIPVAVVIFIILYQYKKNELKMLFAGIILLLSPLFVFLYTTIDYNDLWGSSGYSPYRNIYGILNSIALIFDVAGIIITIIFSRRIDNLTQTQSGMFSIRRVLVILFLIIGIIPILIAIAGLAVPGGRG